MDQGLLYVIIGLGIVLAIFATINLAAWIQDFRKELRYLNAEIARTTGEEREQWKRRKKRLWLSLIPFVRR